MDVNSLLDKAKEMCGVRMDKELAARLGVKPSAISNYRSGTSQPDAVVCATLAGLTGEPLARVLGVVGEARAISREEKAVWRRLAATATLLAVGVLGAAQQPAQAGKVDSDSISQKTPGLLIMFGAAGYWWRLARDVLASRLRRKAGADTLEATVCL